MIPMTPIQKRKNKKITKQKVPFVTRKFKNDALEEIWTSSIVMMLLETESIKNQAISLAGIHFIIEPYVTLTFSFNFTAAYLF